MKWRQVKRCALTFGAMLLVTDGAAADPPVEDSMSSCAACVKTPFDLTGRVAGGWLKSSQHLYTEIEGAAILADLSMRVFLGFPWINGRIGISPLLAPSPAASESEADAGAAWQVLGTVGLSLTPAAGLVAELGIGLAYFDNDFVVGRPHGRNPPRWGWGGLVALGYWFDAGPLLLGPSFEIRRSTTHESGLTGEGSSASLHTDAMAIGVGIGGTYR